MEVKTVVSFTKQDLIDILQQKGREQSGSGPGSSNVSFSFDDLVKADVKATIAYVSFNSEKPKIKG